MNTVYLDNNATTRVADEVYEEVIFPFAFSAGPRFNAGKVKAVSSKDVEHIYKGTCFMGRCKNDRRFIRVFVHVWLDDVRYVHGQHSRIIIGSNPKNSIRKMHLSARAPGESNEKRNIKPILL